MTTPSKPIDQDHKIRLMYGAGLRPQIWETFVKRFKIPNICEIFGSAEGNSNICNMKLCFLISFQTETFFFRLSEL